MGGGGKVISLKEKVISGLVFELTNFEFALAITPRGLFAGVIIIIVIINNPASVLENYTHKLLWDFDIQTDYLISARRLNLTIINKKKKKRENL